MQDFAISIDGFLKFNRYDILEGFGQVSQQMEKAKHSLPTKNLITVKNIF